MRHIWTVLCEKSTIDKDSNNISLYNVLEKINIGGPIEELTNLSKSEKGKVFRYHLSLVSLWARGEEKGDINFIFKLELENPEGKILAEEEREITLEGKYKRTRTRIEMNGVKITGPGTYIFRVKKKDNSKYKTCAEIPLEISLQKK